MTKYEWESELKRHIAGLPKEEQTKALEFYNELFEDKIESGYKEKRIIAEFGNPRDVADKILEEYNAGASRAAASLPAEPERSDEPTAPIWPVTAELPDERPETVTPSAQAPADPYAFTPPVSKAEKRAARRRRRSRVGYIFRCIATVLAVVIGIGLLVQGCVVAGFGIAALPARPAAGVFHLGFAAAEIAFSLLAFYAARQMYGGKRSKRTADKEEA